MVQGTVEPGSTGTVAKGAETGSSPGRRSRMGGQALRQHSKEIPVGSEPIRVYGAGAGVDWLRAGGKPGSSHLEDSVPTQSQGDGGTPCPDRRTH